jgi:hypothetical protein
VSQVKGSAASFDCIPCRLCGGVAEQGFSSCYLGKYAVRFYRCGTCQSLQTEPPYWLNEAYAGGPVHESDPNYLRRGLMIFALVKMLVRILRIREDEAIIDYGGGIGIVPRLLADEGFRALNFDAYAPCIFGTEIDLAKQGPPGEVGMVVLTEVLEHLANPDADFAAIFRLVPRYIFATTAIYRGQGGDWYYIKPETGQHVFFYSRGAIEGAARKRGYVAYIYGDRIVLARDALGPLQRAALSLLIRSKLNTLRLLWAFAGRRRLPL